MTELIKRFCYDKKEVQGLSKQRKKTRDIIRKKIESGEYKIVFTACPLCESKESIHLASKERHSLPVKVVVCKDCGLVYNSERLSPEALNDFYEHHCYSLDRGDFPFNEYLLNQAGKGDRLFELLGDLKLLDNLKGKFVLEIGAGAGGILKAFKDRNYEVLGCELSGSQVDFAKKRYGINILHGTFDDIVKYIKENNLDVGLIIYEQVFEHIVHPREELAKIFGIMDDDMLLYIGVPGIKNIDNHYESDFLSYLEIDHLIHFSLQTLNNFLKFAGFKNIYGDENIRAVYKKDSDHKGQIGKVNCQETLDYLKAMELRFQVNKTSILRRFINKFQS